MSKQIDNYLDNIQTELYLAIPIPADLVPAVTAIGAGLLGMGLVIRIIAGIHVRHQKKKFPECKNYKPLSTNPEYRTDMYKYKICVSTGKIKAYTAEINDLSKFGSSDCKKSKDPAKCKSKVAERITELREKINKEKKLIESNKKWLQKAEFSYD